MPWGSGTSDVARYALGAMLGLAVVGLVLLAMSVVSRRGSPPEARSRERASTAKV
jgi:hypothetical protein